MATSTPSFSLAKDSDTIGKDAPVLDTSASDAPLLKISGLLTPVLEKSDSLTPISGFSPSRIPLTPSSVVSSNSSSSVFESASSGSPDTAPTSHPVSNQSVALSGIISSSKGQDYSAVEKYQLLVQTDSPWSKILEKSQNTRANKVYAPVTFDRGVKLSEAGLKALEGKRSKDCLFDSELITLTGSHRSVARWQWRTYSFEGFRVSSGFSSPIIYLPNSHKHKLKIHSTLRDLTREDASNLLGAHLSWQNRCEDEFLSWTTSPLFLFPHAILRHEKGQQRVYIVFGDVKELQTRHGDPAPIYSATLALDQFEVQQQEGLTEHARRKLHPRHFTHESLTYGEMRDPDRVMSHVALEELVKHGLFDLIPELDVTGLLERSGLYTHVVALKRELHREAKAKPISLTDLSLCEGLAKLFKHENEVKTPLYALIHLLAVRKRPTRNDNYRKWIREHYTGKHNIVHEPKLCY